jgi:hypothetical protein
MLLDFITDEFMLEEILNFEDGQFLKIEDDTIDICCILNKSQIVGIEWEEIIERENNEKV